MKNELTINGQFLKFTSLDKVLFPKSHITKRQLLEYYLTIAPLFLKYLRNRPLTLERFPKGIEASGFVQKHADFFPSWIKHVELPTKAGLMEYLIANKKADVAYLSNLNTIAFHITFSTIKNVNLPDTLIWDLDPSDTEFEKVIEVAQIIKQFCDKASINVLLKTTGSRGLHVLMPLKGTLEFEEIHTFSKKIAYYLANEYPHKITIASLKSKRDKKVLIDYSRNSYGLTAVAPYSLRAIEGAPIAVPVEWEELGKKVLRSNEFNIHNIFDRLKEKGDIWSKLKNKNFNTDTIIKKLNNEI